MRIHKLVRGGMLGAAAALFLAGTVLAYWEVTGKAVNILTSASYRTEIEEEYTVPQHVDPGTSVDKIVNVKNSGKTDVLVRVKLEKAFGTRDADGILQKEEALDPEMIEITCNERFWKRAGDYWYYTEVLAAGERTKEPLMESYRVSEKAGNAYRGKAAEIVVSMESIQAEGDAVSLWGITKKDLGIRYASDSVNTVTAVTFSGKEEGFQFSESDTDLFANFKNLLPGCSRTQKIRIKNSSQDKTEIFLHAEAANQEQMTDKQKRLVSLMLSKYAKIIVKQGNKTLYQGPVDGNLLKTEYSMGNEISLGTFEPGENQDLNVTLSMSRQMDNEMQSLSGKVKWIFTAKGQEEGGTSTAVPKTGDSTDLAGVLVAFVGSIVLLIIACLMKRRCVK